MCRRSHERDTTSSQSAPMPHSLTRDAKQDRKGSSRPPPPCRRLLGVPRHHRRFGTHTVERAPDHRRLGTHMPFACAVRAWLAQHPSFHIGYTRYGNGMDASPIEQVGSRQGTIWAGGIKYRGIFPPGIEALPSQGADAQCPTPTHDAVAASPTLLRCQILVLLIASR